MSLGETVAGSAQERRSLRAEREPAQSTNDKQPIAAIAPASGHADCPSV
jgi:hypothetical protein